tara:strand:+ start:478 stop:621 length:144 start_codon:yes stop_codon:yes gene_type:complete
LGKGIGKGLDIYLTITSEVCWGFRTSPAYLKKNLRFFANILALKYKV